MKQDKLEFTSNLSAAFAEQTSRGARLVIFVSVLGVLWFIIWAYFAKIDEVTRGIGQIIPSSKVQMVQNLEGGIVEEILVKEGDEVKKNQVLLKLKNQGFQSSFAQSEINLIQLKLQALRLKAQISQKPFLVDENVSKQWNDLVENQKNIYKTNLQHLKNQENTVKAQIEQKQSFLNETKVKIRHLKNKLKLVKKQIAITKPLVESKVESETNFLSLKREKIDIAQQLEVSSSSIKGLRSAIEELKSKQKEFYLNFQAKSQKELNDALIKIASLEEQRENFADKVTRTKVLSPTKGIV
ncbi:MAG: biotin/lipoyl-binding protein, partial [Arcobacter sp.]|nr:biotin/lipoyl-binding protein [Arcobacter sp.]